MESETAQNLILLRIPRLLASSRWEQLTKDKAHRQQDVGTATAAIESFDSEPGDLLKRTGVQDDADVVEAIKGSKRKAELTKAIREHIRAALAQSAGGTPVDTFLNEIRTASIEARQNQVQELEQRIRD